MTKATSVVAACVMVLAAACNDMPSSVESSKQFAIMLCEGDAFSVCGYTITSRTPSDTIPAYAGTNRIVFGENGVMVLIMDADILAYTQFKAGTQLLLAGLTGPVPSDTIPGPIPVGPVHAMYAQLGGSAFAAVAGLSGPLPSDTIPGPGPMGHVKIGNYDADADQEVAIWASIKHLTNTKIITPNTTHLLLQIKNGKSVLTSAAMPVDVFVSEKIWTH